MGFENLTPEMQDLVMVNFEFFAKIFLTLVVFGITASYIFYFSKRQEPTPFLLVSLFRGISYIVSWIVLTSIPLFVFFLYPNVSFDVMIRFLFITYTVFYLVIGILFFINIMYIVPLVALKYGGFDVDKARTKGFIDKLNLFSEFNNGKKSKGSSKRRLFQSSINRNETPKTT